ncbi:hypothetical protein M8756_20700, partial [Lutimaribacter sp. EGI FJ00015]|nr:hypothetical protein [Lutimaribacter sp. EGI FJ00015]
SGRSLPAGTLSKLMSVSFKNMWQTSAEYYSQLAPNVFACFRLHFPFSPVLRRYAEQENP